MNHPLIIQGGMGAAVSDWRLARAVARTGQLGVVSGTALATVLCRRLQAGDSDGRCRHALSHFPIPGVADRLIAAHFVEGGKPPGAPFRLTPLPTLDPSKALVELTVAANFVEVFLAREGHDGRVGINLLEKIQLPTLPSLFGAMLAGVDYVLMGAGIPRAIPGSLDRLAAGEAVSLRIDVEGAQPGEEFLNTFDPGAFCGGSVPQLRRPFFLAIVSSATLAITLARKSNGRVDGFVIEADTAGGHNAPPRGPLQLSPEGEPIYGPRDIPDLERFRELGLPFWLAGTQGRPGSLARARQLGAAGIQVGTAFAFCAESGIRTDLRRRVLEGARQGSVRVFTDPLASPTGFPFKVVQLPASLADNGIYEARERICDLGYLRHPYRREDGSVGYRCPSEPIAAFMAKGGAEAETRGRKCVCNGLIATVGFPQQRSGGDVEPPLLTAGNDLERVANFVPPDGGDYSAAEVVRRLLADDGNPGPPA